LLDIDGVRHQIPDLFFYITSRFFAWQIM